MTKAKKNHLQIHQMTIGDFERLFPNEDACRDYLAANRWPNGVRCPRCGNDNVHAHSGKPHHWNPPRDGLVMVPVPCMPIAENRIIGTAISVRLTG
jgi:hypothetical protein